MNNHGLIPHLFRTEFPKITAVLTRFLGIEHIAEAEDIVGETFLAALESWPYKGIPPNPTAWLYTVAKNKAKNYISRSEVFFNKVITSIEHPEDNYLPEVDLSESNINDSTLKMLFAVCTPVISSEAQVTLSLRLLCGFGIEEIANAFLSNKETINKRLLRAKEKLRQIKAPIELPPVEEISKRLDTVLATLYLLYNEGYYSESNDEVLREDLCGEAMRLTYLLINNSITTYPKVNALFALMCFQSSRFAARKGNNGEMILYDEQDESLWSQELISKGAWHMQQAAQGNELSRYHLEASIAYCYTIKADTIEKWENILQLFNHLLQISYSPVAALNRTYALSKARGKPAAIIEAEKLELTNSRFYYTLLGELYSGIDNKTAKTNFEKALEMARSPADKQGISWKIERII